MPLGGDSSISTNFVTRNWAGNWEKIVGGKGTLVFDFDGDDEVFFKVPYLLCDFSGKCHVDFLKLDKNQKGEMIIPGFNLQYESLTIIPSIQSKFLGFDGPERSYIFSRKVSIAEKTEVEKDAELKQELLAHIDFLNKEIARVQSQINAILVLRGQNNNQSTTCGDFKNDLYLGMKNSSEVSCLQEFLKKQGSEIYPEGLVTGNFLDLTELALIRFQEKYQEEILKPLGLERGTGFLGARSRDKINKLLR